MKKTYTGTVFIIPQSTLMIDPRLQRLEREVAATLQEFADGKWKDPSKKDSNRMAVTNRPGFFLGDTCVLSDGTVVLIAAETQPIEPGKVREIKQISVLTRDTVITLPPIHGTGLTRSGLMAG